MKRREFLKAVAAFTACSGLGRVAAENSRKGVIGMKLLGAGGLTDRVDECLAYASSLECINAFTIGCRVGASSTTC